MNVNYNYFGILETPELTLCSPNDKQIGQLDNIKNFNISPEFNALSEMNLDIYKYNNDGIELSIFEQIKNHMEILVDGLGYFIITTCKTIKEGNNKYKSITCYSCESELSYKDVTYLKGTFKFYDEDNTSTTLMGKLLDLLPNWSIGNVSVSVKNKYRTFDVPEDNIYNFLMNDVEETYGCIFEFDILNRIINVYDKNNYVNISTIYLSTNDVLKSITENTNEDNIFTCCKVTGDDDLGISDVNPLGTNYIYNFDNVLDMMSDDLSSAISNWEDIVSDNIDTYANLLTTIKVKNTELQTLESELLLLQSNLSNYKIQLDAIISLSGDTTTVKGYINTVNSNISTKENEITIKEQEIEVVQSSINAIHNTCSFESNFTSSQLLELDRFIWTTTYDNTNICVTESMTYEDAQNQKLELYNMAKEQLEEWCKAGCEFELDTDGFIFSNNFKPYAENLELGKLLDLELNEDDIGSFIILKYTVDYENKTLDITLGNRYRCNNSSMLFTDDLNKASKSSTTLSLERTKYGKAVNSGVLSEAQQFMNNSLALNNNAIVSENGQTVEVTDSGYHGRKVVDGVVDDEEVAIVHNKIAFTDNGWDTCKTALGKILLDDGTEKYGLAGEFIYGNILAGQGLKISTSDNSFSVDENGMHSDILDTASVGTLVYYYLSSSTTELLDGTWSVTAPEWVDGKYMWQKTITTYVNGTTTETEPTCIAGAKGSDGQPGINGVSISSITNYYLSSEFSSGITTSTSGWTTTIQSMTIEKPYLWNYEIIIGSDEEVISTTDPIVIGRYGQDGTDGIGISNIVEHYAVSSSNSIEPTVWYNTVQMMTTTDKYLWNYETINYTNGTSNDTLKRVIGAYGNQGEDGVGVTNVIAEYAICDSDTTAPTDGWGITPPEYESNKYYWSRTHIYYDNDTDTTTTPVLSNDINGIRSTLAQTIMQTDNIQNVADILNAITSSATETSSAASANMSILDSQIKAYVSTLYVSKTEDDDESTIADIKNYITSQLEMTSSSLETRFTNDLSGYVDLENYTEFKNSLTTIIRETSEGIYIGKEANGTDMPYSVLLSNTKLSFLNGGVEVAYISNNMLYITQAEFTQRLTIGNDNNGRLDWITTDTGVGLKWR